VKKVELGVFGTSSWRPQTGYMAQSLGHLRGASSKKKLESQAGGSFLEGRGAVLRFKSLSKFNAKIPALFSLGGWGM
jgi:hypothetical protein